MWIGRTRLEENFGYKIHLLGKFWAVRDPCFRAFRTEPSLRFRTNFEQYKTLDCTDFYPYFSSKFWRIHNPSFGINFGQNKIRTLDTTNPSFWGKIFDNILAF